MICLNFFFLTWKLFVLIFSESLSFVRLHELQALIFLLALVVRAANRPADYDSDDEYIGGPRQQIRQPLINNRPPANPATGVPVTATLDNRPSRNDAWSTRMREKVCFLLIALFACRYGSWCLTFSVDCSLTALSFSVTMNSSWWFL